MCPFNAKGPPIADAKGGPEAVTTFARVSQLSRTVPNRLQDFSHSLAAFVAAIDPAAIAAVVAIVIAGATT